MLLDGKVVLITGAAGGEVLALPADLTDGASVNGLVDTVVAEYGRLDGAFNKCRGSDRAAYAPGGEFVVDGGYMAG
ncbi:hypothetical protein [Nocardia amikacinitolerans]|uniref:hypothetical protein n=1 Tax=Nocardia amikacinitolerans TaxID=756689 RepID=UPI0020A439A2|nr:hypothetical protein [Nocardia amikacinitolerans]MCP2276251.1 hypothetical protein [Nocardia amikacinitolerans]